MEQFPGFNSFNSPNLDNNFERPVSPGIKKFTTEQFAKQLESLDLERQQEIAAVGYFLIRQRTESLGIEIKDFELSSVVTDEEYFDHFRSDFLYSTHLENASAVYDRRLNKIASNGNGLSLSNATHEMEHYVSDKQNTQTIGVNEKMHRTGFDLYYVPGESKPDEAGRSYFGLFNEGITEMISHDLCDGITTEKLGSLYKGIFPQKAKQNLENSKADYEDWLKKIAVTEKEIQEKELAEFTPFIAQITDEKEIEKYTKAHIGRMGMCQRMRESRKKDLEYMEILPFAPNEDPLENKDMVAYSHMVELLPPLLNGIARKKAKEKNSSFEMERVEAWKDLQRAYFSGDTAYLNVLESTFGKGFLKKLANLDYKQIVIDEENETTTWKEYDEIKSIIESAA